MEAHPWCETPLRVRYKDTDRMGVVYYGNYLTYFEIARAELMRTLEYSYRDLEADGYRLVVIEAYAKYHGNAQYDALLRAKARVADVGRVRLRFDYRVGDQGGRLLVSGYTVHACVNADTRPTRIPRRLLEAIQGN